MNASDHESNLTRLCQIMSTLRSDSGCPWDREQTPESLKPYILEEACELLEALDRGNRLDIQEELGDLLLQIVFLAQIYREQNQFDLSDVIESICNKMIRRHPHVFADSDAADHARRWEELKAMENRDKGRANTLAQRIPATLPALKRAQKLAQKMPSTDAATLLSAMEEHHHNLAVRLAAQPGQSKGIELIIADLLMLTSQLSATLKIDAEDLLRQKTTLLINRIDDEKITRCRS